MRRPLLKIALKAFEFFPTNERAAGEVEHFWSAIAFITNALIFLLTGLTLRVGRMLHEPLLLFAVFMATLLARAVLAYAILPLFAGVKHAAWRHVVAIAGLRGGVALALTLSLPPRMPHRAMLIDIVFGVVFLTLVLQGAPLAPVLRHLGVSAPKLIDHGAPVSEAFGSD